MDSNRNADGVDLRRHFTYHTGIECDISNDIASVLEMMIALVRRCESNIMANSEYGNRVSYWFWEMIANMGLDGMDNVHWDEHYVESRINSMLDRLYLPDGRGGLFSVPDIKYDMREVDIWYQAMYYFSSLNE